MSAVAPAWSPELAREVLASVRGPGPVLVALQTVQETFGYVPRDAVDLIAEHANVSRAEVHGVLTYYRDLRTTPPPAVEVQICLGEACQSVGARQLLTEAERYAGTECEVRHVYCLGNCALGPAAMVHDELIGRASSDDIAARLPGTGQR